MSNRNSLAAQKPRYSKNLEHLKNVQINGAAGRGSSNVFSSLRNASMVSSSKAALPAELIATILDYLPVPDLIRFAQVSRRMQEMVYDDTRWVQKLRSMDAWNETEARQRVEDAMKRRAEAQRATRANASRTGAEASVESDNATWGMTIFDAGVEEKRYRNSLEGPPAPHHRARASLNDGFSELAVSSPMHSGSAASSLNPNLALTVFDKLRSMRGHARQEFGRIYAALNPIYHDLASVTNHASALIFRTFRDPEQQAKALANLTRFALSDTGQGWQHREDRLETIAGMFENAVLREFEQGYVAGDVDGRMHRYAHVLCTLNGGSAVVDAFIANHPIMTRSIQLGNPLKCLEAIAPGHVDLSPSQAFFERSAAAMVDQAGIIDKVFPHSLDVLTPFLSRFAEEFVSEFLTALFDEAHSKDRSTYVKAVAGTFGQALRFVASLVATKASPANFPETSRQMIVHCFEQHIDLYLTEELELFRTKSAAEVNQWEKELSEQEATTESFFMSNVSRQAAKRDFLSSFRKVVMMPVNALPAFPLASPFAAAKPPTAAARAAANFNNIDTSYAPAGNGASTPPGISTPTRSETPLQELPTTELAAKAAIMNSRLEGIKSLFSVEIAVGLTHLAKDSIERASLMVQMGGESGDLAREQCETVFVAMLDILGNRHIKNGFDKAVEHLGNYNPREVRKFRETSRNTTAGVASDEPQGVEPLVTFLELVNIGDLIQQMIDVFYAQELVAKKLTDRDDFLDPAVKEKKRFEQMLDERVAAGLNKGIDVLIDEVEYICATTQPATDFNPEGTTKTNNTALPPSPIPDVVDIGPSSTAKQVVDMVGGHTSMLVGSTDKNMLDVFTQEVGLRLFGALCKHFKRQRVSVTGAIKLISDINHYSSYVASLHQKPLMPYYQALRELSQIYLVHIDPPVALFAAGPTGKRTSLLSTKSSPTALQAKELATIIADNQRYHGIFPAEEVYEFAERRADWFLVKNDVERAMYGVGCALM